MKFIYVTPDDGGSRYLLNLEDVSSISWKLTGSGTVVELRSDRGSHLIKETPEQIGALLRDHGLLIFSTEL